MSKCWTSLDSFIQNKDGFNQLFTLKSRLLAKKCQMLLYMRRYGILQFNRYYLVTLGETRPCLGIGDCSGGFDVDKIIRLT